MSNLFRAISYAGAGTPNGFIVGNIGDLYTDTGGGVGTTLWIKSSGNGTNTGWSLVSSGTPFFLNALLLADTTNIFGGGSNPTSGSLPVTFTGTGGGGGGGGGGTGSATAGAGSGGGGGGGSVSQSVTVIVNFAHQINVV